MTTNESVKDTANDGSDAVSFGVSKLINRLHEDGVKQGQIEANRILENAEKEAQSIIENARRKAENMIENAEQESARLRQSSEDAIKVASRDALLSVKEQLGQCFANMLAGEISDETSKDECLQNLIIAVAGKVTEAAKITADEKLTISLPQQPVTLEQLRKNSEKAEEGTLAYFVSKKAKTMLREGVELKLRNDRRAGIKVKADDRGLELALTDEDIADLLLAHLQPRFRALVEGLIRS